MPYFGERRGMRYHDLKSRVHPGDAKEKMHRAKHGTIPRPCRAAVKAQATAPGGSSIAAAGAALVERLRRW
jgi:hypothetical protein